jgi:hypothetical protein
MEARNAPAKPLAAAPAPVKSTIKIGRPGYKVLHPLLPDSSADPISSHIGHEIERYAHSAKILDV